MIFFLPDFYLSYDVGVKRDFDPFDTGLFRTSYSHNPQKHSQSAHFSSKNGYLLMFLTGPKFRNLPASKLASDFRPFDPDILSCSGLFYNLSYTHVVHIYQHLYLIFSTFYRTLFTPEAYSATSSSVSFSAFFISPSENTSLPTKRPPAG